MKTLISLCLLVSTLFLSAQAPPILRQRYTTNTQAVVDAYVAAQVAAGTNVSTGTGATVLSNAPSINAAKMLGDQTATNSSLTEVKQTASGGFYRRQLMSNGTVQYQESVLAGDYLFVDSANSRNIFNYSASLATMWLGVPWAFTNNLTYIDSPVIGSNVTYVTSLNLPSSNLTNYTVRPAGMAVINATNTLNFQTFFNPTGAQVSVVTTLITNLSGSPRVVGFVGAPSLFWNTAIPTVISNQSTAMFVTRHTSNSIMASWSAVNQISSPPYVGSDSNVTANGFSVQLNAATQTNAPFVVRSNNGTALLIVRTNGNVVPQVNNTLAIGEGGVQFSEVVAQTLFVNKSGGSGGAGVSNDASGSLLIRKGDGTGLNSVKWGSGSLNSGLGVAGMFIRDVAATSPTLLSAGEIAVSGSNGLSFNYGITAERSTSIQFDSGLKRVSSGWMRFYGTNGGSLINPPPNGSVEVSNVVSVGTLLAPTLVLTNKTTAPTAATIGANNGWLQCSNGALYYFTTTDGSVLLTTKLTITP